MAKNLPIDVLRSFVTIWQLGSFTQAAELLGRTQPAISLQIKRLEETLGHELFSRNGSDLELTEFGRTIVTYANQILALNDEALASVSKASLTGRVRLGIPSEFATTLLPKIVSRFARAYPGVTLEVQCDLSKNLLSPSSKNRYDLVLALHDNPRAAGHKVKSDELVWVTGNDPSIYNQPTIPLIAAPAGCIYRNRATKKLDAAGHAWRIVYTIPDLTGIQAAIEEGLGITVLARSTVPENLRIIRSSQRLPKLGKMGISLLRPSAKENAALDKIEEYLKTKLT